jgi:Na+-driven multidrug efflux pump
MSGSVFFGLLMAVLGAATTLLIPFVFANLSSEARIVTRGLVLVISAYFPSWTLLNAQFAVARSGGDTVMGMWVDVGVTIALVVPLAFILAKLTSIGPVAMFALVKLSDFLKASIAAWWLKKERWLRNLTVMR